MDTHELPSGSPLIDASSPTADSNVFCRICRTGETKEEPLFYPCKCSGSIKFVHQDCLMEWLSHSQKKYCELCKTPFRFTKLYDPQMPQVLPLSVFLRKATLHSIKYFMTWLRGILVTLVWLVLLPLTMRNVWRYMFWFADAGWARSRELESSWGHLHHLGANNNSLYRQMQDTKSGKLNATMSQSSRNTSVEAPFMFKIMKYLILEQLGKPHSPELEVAMRLNTTFGPDTDPLIRQKYSSLLSDVGLFRDLTSSPLINRSVMDVVEGLIVTMSVVIAFVLVFLIREWVVQQQPMLELAANVENVDPIVARVVDQAEDAQVDENDEIPGPNEIPEPLLHDENIFDEPENPVDSEGSDNNFQITPESSNIDIKVDPEDSSKNSASQPIRPMLNNRESTPSINDIHQTILNDMGYAETEEYDVQSTNNTSPLFHNSQSTPTDLLNTVYVGDVDENFHSNEESQNEIVPGEASQNDEIRPAEETISLTSQATPADPATQSAQSDPSIIQQRHQKWYIQLYDFFWGDVIPLDQIATLDGANDDQIAVDANFDQPFIPFQNGEPILQQDQQPAGNQIGADLPPDIAQNDIDVEDAVDAEDMEGILELIGMQGNILNLFQNAIFCSFLLVAALLWSILFPYMLGKLIFLCSMNFHLLWEMPVALLRGVVEFAADVVLLIGGTFMSALTSTLNWASFKSGSKRVWIPKTIADSQGFADRAGNRLLESLVSTASIFDPSLLLFASIQSHQALIGIQNRVDSATKNMTDLIHGLKDMRYNISNEGVWQYIVHEGPNVLVSKISNDYNTVSSTLAYIWTSLVQNGSVTFSIPHKESYLPSMVSPDASIAYWSAKDRSYAITLGYVTLALLAALYVSKLAPLSTGGQAKRFEMKVVELILQAGGVFKVIFIISIEMIVFPLFCGFLLDFALLPLFEISTVASRIAFTLNSPWTSGFIHWFVGTCYMFHFALFVSMCRKLMRPGVLYFIRDPDDPNFHPVRDVLERNVMVQLRKILFSAVVYGTLILVCLGGVVWLLWSTSFRILPIHWSSTRSALEFPIDIIFYNILTPWLVKITKPSEGLYAIYGWWFKKCASLLRLSNFLFGNDNQSERGHHVRKTWTAWIWGKRGDEDRPYNPEKEESEPEVYFVKDGKYARVPDRDQIRIPKGQPVFLEVDENNVRLDGKPDNGIHSDARFVKKIYIPPWFKLRIGVFVLLVWLFAAATGVCITIIPLIFGRIVLSLLGIQDANDIYAFSLGIYIVGTCLYFGFHIRSVYNTISSQSLESITSSAQASFNTIFTLASRAASLFFVYSYFFVIVPLLLAALLELYILLPFHTFLAYLPQDSMAGDVQVTKPKPSPTHTIHLVQDWTLGLLYLRIFARVLLAPTASISSRLLRAVIDPAKPAYDHGGVLNPNARIATRAFIIPSLIVFIAIAILPGASTLAIVRGMQEMSKNKETLLVRMSYPITFAIGVIAWMGWVLREAVGNWRGRIRDEVYLVGERLHNFREKGKGRAAG